MLTESYTVRAPSRTGSILASQSGGDLALVGGEEVIASKEKR